MKKFVVAFCGAVICVASGGAFAAQKITLTCDSVEECQKKLDLLRPKARLIRAAPKPTNATALAPSNTPKGTNPIDVKVFVRKSLEDLGSFADPSALADATGAEFSWTRNRTTANDTWAAQGLAGIRLLYWGDPNRSTYLSHGTFASYVQFDRQTNSTLTTNDVDDLTLGFSSEIALANAWSATHYLRTKGEVVTDFGGREKNWDVTLEYQPFGTRSPEKPNTVFSYFANPLPLGPYFYLTIAPKLRAEYRARLNDSTDPIFTAHNHVLRVGPAVTINIDGDRVFPEHTPEWIQRLHYQFVYGYLYDTTSNRDYRYFDTALTYNLDRHGYLGLTLSYRRGEQETTGKQVDIAKISLSAKFGED